ncbi:peptidoglycan bridge formation glycyltransferase FemA/FemB family protein [Candidatus Gottesmanbacteria bacterium]|nr:peptidoglycan bridge formation glycyltransferase FemA/FemB family protein [Candidatus Gottesmanbacteria bacterium]
MTSENLSMRTPEKSDRSLWDSLATHPLQSWAWGEFRKAMGVKVERLLMLKNKKPVDAWQISFHKIPKLPYTIGYFPKGPKPYDFMISTLKDLGKKNNAIFIQLEPNIQLSAESCQPSALKPSHHPLFTKYTFILDIAKTEEELLQSFHQKTRYNIRLAQKKGVKIAEDNSDNAFEEFIRLSKETTKRQGFYAHNEIYQKTLWNIFSKNQNAQLFTATYEGKTLAAWVMFILHDTLYYPYGASSRDHRDVMAPNLMLWEIIRWGKKHGIKTIDLWGALGPPKANGSNEKDPWFGFHKFKEGYSPTLIEFIGSFDLVLQPVLYSLYTFADTARFSLLHFFSRI